MKRSINQSIKITCTTTILATASGSHKNNTSKGVTVNKLFKGVILILMCEFYSSLESLLLLFEVILTLILGHSYSSGLINFPVGGHFDCYEVPSYSYRGSFLLLLGVSLHHLGVVSTPYSEL